MHDSQTACSIVNGALKLSLESLEDLAEEDFHDAKSVIELLKENLTLWQEVDDEDSEAEMDETLWI